MIATLDALSADLISDRPPRAESFVVDVNCCTFFADKKSSGRVQRERKRERGRVEEGNKEVENVDSISSRLLFRLAKCRVVSVISVRRRVCYKERRSNAVRDSVRTSREFEITRPVFAAR